MRERAGDHLFVVAGPSLGSQQFTRRHTGTEQAQLDREALAEQPDDLLDDRCARSAAVHAARCKVPEHGHDLALAVQALGQVFAHLTVGQLAGFLLLALGRKTGGVFAGGGLLVHHAVRTLDLGGHLVRVDAHAHEQPRAARAKADFLEREACVQQMLGRDKARLDFFGCADFGFAEAVFLEDRKRCLVRRRWGVARDGEAAERDTAGVERHRETVKPMRRSAVRNSGLPVFPREVRGKRQDAKWPSRQVAGRIQGFRLLALAS